jgi:hypothetical protein
MDRFYLEAVRVHRFLTPKQAQNPLQNLLHTSPSFSTTHLLETVRTIPQRTLAPLFVDGHLQCNISFGSVRSVDLRERSHITLEKKRSLDAVRCEIHDDFYLASRGGGVIMPGEGFRRLTSIIVCSRKKKVVKV